MILSVSLKKGFLHYAVLVKRKQKQLYIYLK